jgi:transposase-like protein
VIVVAVRWYLRYGLSYRDVEELLVERGVEVDHVTVFRWEADHGLLKHRLRPMRGLRTHRTAQVIIAGHAFVHNLRRGHYELGRDVQPSLRVAAAFTELARAI